MKKEKNKRVLILCRVSTQNQETENQLLQLRQYCVDKGFEIVKEISENISGKSEERKGIEMAIQLASQAKYDLLLFWNLDRFSRLGILKTLQYFKTLESYGVEIKSFTQPYLDTSNSAIRELLLAFFSYIAHFQLVRYSEDIKSGQKRALAKGKRIGRPKVLPETKNAIRELKNKGYSNRKIASQLGVDEKTVRNIIKSF